MIPNLTIGAVAKRAGVNIQTVFYYERRGILAPADRTPSGYRLYEETAVDALRFIKNAQSLGFSLDEIKRLMGLRVRRPGVALAVRRKAQSRLEVIRGKIAKLRSMEKALQGLIRSCVRRVSTSECPILDSFEKTEESCSKKPASRTAVRYPRPKRGP